ncbi:hypothetical protein CYMTET_24981 [Cymbomonas tetramitiformis]|uniref:Uncharacterized protein n=1 Tax=Cymbomonas tetramitiformis TaxID=36881 RepID=A0AAE0FVH8_9CHLO|nr:hypothetical protein CYMTET_24981 [Cymbomonas tetramitiformis]
MRRNEIDWLPTHIGAATANYPRSRSKSKSLQHSRSYLGWILGAVVATYILGSSYYLFNLDAGSGSPQSFVEDAQAKVRESHHKQELQNARESIRNLDEENTDLKAKLADALKGAAQQSQAKDQETAAQADSLRTQLSQQTAARHEQERQGWVSATGVGVLQGWASGDEGRKTARRVKELENEVRAASPIQGAANVEQQLRRRVSDLEMKEQTMEQTVQQQVAEIQRKATRVQQLEQEQQKHAKEKSELNQQVKTANEGWRNAYNALQEMQGKQ